MGTHPRRPPLSDSTRTHPVNSRTRRGWQGLYLRSLRCSWFHFYLFISHAAGRSPALASAQSFWLEKFMKQNIIDAIKNKSVLSFSYDGHPRTVEPHTVGMNHKSNIVLRCFQTSGTSSDAKVPGWKLMKIDKIEGFRISDDAFDSPRPGYNKGDKAMKEIYAEV